MAAAQARTKPLTAALFWVMEIPIQVPLLLVVFGVNPNFDLAFYMTALVFHLFEAALVLAQLSTHRSVDIRPEEAKASTSTPPLGRSQQLAHTPSSSLWTRDGNGHKQTGRSGERPERGFLSRDGGI